MKHKVVIAGLVLILLIISLAGSKVISTLAAPDQRASGSALSQESPADTAIREAFQQTVTASRDQQSLLATMIYDVYIDEIFYSNDGLTALLWLGMRDIETGEVIAAEPGISIAQIQNRFAPARAESWQITLQPDQNWYDQLKSLPEELMTEDITKRFLQPDVEEAFAAAASTVYTGYKLPWAANLKKRITQSIGHYLEVSGGWTSCPATCQFAYDFADGTMFSIVAAKGGTVKAFKTTCRNGDSKCTNFLILEDQSTTPTTYQVYYHMAYDSIPQHLRVLGARVVQGEYIGDADDTGASTGHHLHYHIYISPNTADWSWGRSVDFVFDDVIAIYGNEHNGGRPRTCPEAAQYPHLGNRCNDRNFYLSGNTPANPPSGSLNKPEDGQMITSAKVEVSGIAMDDIEISRILVLVNHNGTWRPIDNISIDETGFYQKEVDLCTANVPDGPFAITVEIYDREGSLAPGIPVVQLIKNASCSTPAKKQPASVNLLYPKTGEKVPSGPFDIVVDAVDFDGKAVKQVDFFWHGGDWSKHTWVKLGVDRDGSDGWQMTIDPMDYGEISGAAVYVQALSKDGGVLGKVLWNLEADPVKPVSRLNPIPETSESTAVLLSWRASDPNDDLDYFDLEHKVGDGNWQPLTERRISGNARSAWVVAVPGATNSYRLRAVDQQGNVEPFDNKPVATVTVPGSCTPDANESSGQTQSSALLVEKDKLSPTFNFCSSSGADIDWIRVSAPKGQKVSLAVYPKTGSGAGFILSLYDSASQLVHTSQSPDLGQAAGIFWTPPAAGNYYLKIEPLHPGLFGTGTGYQVLFADAIDTYLPGIYR